MGKAKKTRKFAEVKRRISPKDARLKQNKEKNEKKAEAETKEDVRNMYLELFHNVRTHLYK
jgi:U3 small nucleolar RNA-associated protein 24